MHRYGCATNVSVFGIEKDKIAFLLYRLLRFTYLNLMDIDFSDHMYTPCARMTV